MSVFAVTNADAQYMSTPDSLLTTRPVIFRVNRTEILVSDSTWIADTLAADLISVGEAGYIVGRAAASPEGPIANNKRLAEGRRRSAIDYLVAHGFDARQIKFETVTEDYELLITMMDEAKDQDADTVRALFEKYRRDENRMKQALKSVNEGTLWERLLKQYFPDLRAVRIFVAKKTQPIAYQTEVLPQQAQPFTPPIETPMIAQTQEAQQPQDSQETQGSQESQDSQERHDRREMFAVKTNLLLWPFYMPQYGWCPVPNGEVEFYPLHGNFTAGASYDKPWWVHYNRHEVFQVENISFYLRYYFRNGDIKLRNPGEGAAYTGWYGALYGHWFRYQIGLSKNKGWIGEGGGPGIGLGYMLPISKDGHWRLDIGAQFGFFRTKYDPFVYGTPIDRDESSGLYYYDIKYHPSLFQRRQNHFNWFGPTRIGVSLSYDLLYRKGKDRGLRFKKWYKE